MSDRTEHPAAPNTVLHKEGYTYFAFISYKREDEKWAKWLQRKLQSYRLPAAVCKRNKDLPKRLTPVFRDKTNLTPGPLVEELREEVQSSKFLIVICSKKAHNKSEYLDLEIKHFIDGGGTSDRIIPFIVDDSSQPEKDCFPLLLQALCETETILGANVHEAGPYRALIKTIAYMLGVKLETILPVELQRRRRRLTAIITASLALLAGMTACGYYYWDYYVPKTAYYLDYVERYGIPEGIHPLDKDELPFMGAHYTIVSQGHHPIELRHENVYGEIIKHGEIERLDRSSMSTYEYNPDNTLHRATHYNEAGEPILVMEYINTKTINLLRPMEEEAYISASGLLAHSVFTTSNIYETPGFFSEKSNIIRYLIDYYEQGNQKGFISEIRYASDQFNTVAADADGVYGIRYERDPLGRIIRKSYLSYTGKSGNAENADDYEVIGARNGIYSIEFVYDGLDDLTEVYFKGLNDALVFSSRGYAYHLTKFDIYHNPIEESYWDPNGSLVYNIDGVAQIIDTYDHGNRVQRKFLDIDGNLTFNSTDCAAGINFEYYDQGNKLVYHYFGTDGKPIITKDKIATMIVEIKDNLPVRISNLGTDGNPVYDAQGISSIEREYNSDRKLIRESYFGTNNEPIVNNDWYFSESLEYKNGQLKKVVYKNTEGMLTLTKYGCAIIEYDYDRRGNLCRVGYLGTDEQPVISNEGFAVIEYQRNDEGNLLREDYYDANGKKTLNTAGYATIRYEYKGGNCIRISFLGTEGEAVLWIPAFVSVIEQDFDNRGNRVEMRFYDTQGNLTFQSDGSAITREEYDERGNNTKESYFDTDGNPVIGAYGYAAIGQIFDERGNIIRTDYYDTEGNIFITKDGYASILFQYDSHGNIVKQTYLDTAGNLVTLKRRGGYSSITWEYDARDNLTQLSYLNRENQPVPGPEGYASVSYTYDALSRLIREEYYDMDGQLSGFMSYPKRVYIHDESQRISEAYDKDGNLRGGGQEIFDERGRIICTNYFNKDGFVLDKTIYQYDERSNIIRESHYDENNQLMLNPFSSGESWAEMSREYDAHGNVIKTCYYDSDGELRTTDYAILEQTYTIYNNVAESRYYSADGLLTLNNEGYAIYRQLYDDVRRKIEVRYYDTNEQLTNTVLGYAMFIEEFNETGQLIKQSYYDSDEKPTIVSQYGYAAKECEYDESGNLIRALYYDENAQLIEDLSSEKTCIIAYPINDSDTYIIFISLGDWNYLPYKGESTVEAFSLTIEKIGMEPTEYSYLVFNEDEGCLELKTGTFIRGKMGLHVVDQSISEEMFSEIIEAVYSYADATLGRN